ncbi:MAG: hypothetical protein QM692_20620 [Thermomicrobiales bacterium]
MHHARGRAMIITQPALFCLTSFWSRLAGRPEFPQAGPAPAPLSPAGKVAVAPARPPRAAVAIEPMAPAAVQAPSAVVASEPEPATTAPVATSMVTGDDPAPTTPQAGAPLTANERRARAAALRALAFSRARCFDAAQAAFTDAARLDPELDLTRVPSFWSLERSAHEAAIAAYVAADRAGDAAVLRARVHSVYRPKPLRVRPAAAATS